VADERAIIVSLVQQHMERYKSAYESLDAVAVGRILSLSPDTVERLRKQFGDSASYSVAYQLGAITFLSETRATAICQTTITAVMKAGGRQNPQQVRRVFQLAKSGSSWTILSFQ
jgi:hypothetical protein